MIMSSHAAIRANERANLSNCSAEKLAQRALISGRRASDYPARERRYMESKDKETSFCVTYGDNMFIFTNEGKCITMYQLPSWFGDRCHYYKKQIVRNPKKYFSRYCNIYPC